MAIKKSTAEQESIIPGLPEELGAILIRLPRALHGCLRCVCRTWWEALKPSAVDALRKTLHIPMESWTVFQFDSGAIAVYDPSLQRFSAPILTPHVLGKEADERFYKKIFPLGTRGSQALFQEIDILHAKAINRILCFDAASMQWLALPRCEDDGPNEKTEFASTIGPDGHHVFVVGGVSSWVSDNDYDQRSWQESRSVHSMDVRTGVWEALPDMHNRRTNTAVVVLQGRLCVIGGWCDDLPSVFNSGEIWDPIHRRWRLVPKLWPKKFFSAIGPVVAVVMGTDLYAIDSKEINYDCTDGPRQRHLMRYDSVTKLWTSVGRLPYPRFYRCPDCKSQRFWENPYKQLVGVDKELWMVMEGCNGAAHGHNHYASCKVMKCLPPSFEWRILPNTDDSLGPLEIVGSVHV